MIARHGDLLIRPTKAIPAWAKKFSSGKLNKLALGETTGHSHKLQTTTDIEVFELNGEKFFKLDDTSTLSHEEHNTITLKPDTYKVLIEREFDYFLQETRRVLD